MVVSDSDSYFDYRDCGANAMRWWIVLFIGAVFMLTPGMVNPYAVINGATLLGLVLVAWSGFKLVRSAER